MLFVSKLWVGLLNFGLHQIYTWFDLKWGFGPELKNHPTVVATSVG
jgi:hypothetical protein